LVATPSDAFANARVGAEVALAANDAIEYALNACAQFHLRD
jgi:hypothetical protein